MIRWLKKILGFEQLQKAHDLRAVLNGRLSAENKRLRKELGHQKPLKPKAQEHIERMTAQQAEFRALMRVAHQRKEMTMYLMSEQIPLAKVQSIQASVAEMTDEQVSAWTKPKRQNPA